MNVLFLTMAKIDSLEEQGMIYHDLLRKFVQEGHFVTVVTPSERKEGESTQLLKFTDYQILRVKTLNIQKTNVIEKGIGTLAIEYQFLNAIKKYLAEIKFGLVVYSTPPITFTKVVNYIKNKDGAYSYLLLKDIFPQNAVDMKMLKKDSFLHRMFRKKEEKLYECSDMIGCMSPANVRFLQKYHPHLDPKKIEVNPNSIGVTLNPETSTANNAIRQKFRIPADKTVFIYGGNLGKPQGIDFLIEILEKNQTPDAFFVIVGTGTEYSKIEKWFSKNKPEHAVLLPGLPKSEYNSLLAAADVGLIFLHQDFLIPNFPARFLSYLDFKKPVISATDPNTDIGDIIETANCGIKVLAGDSKGLISAVNKLSNDEDLRKMMGENGRKLLLQDYQVERTYRLIIEKIL